MPAETPVRTPRARLGGARLLVGLVLALLVPGALVLTALAADPPAPPPTTTALRHPSLPQAPDSVAQAEINRSAAATRAARRLDAPRLLTEPGSALPTLALAPRSTPYTLAELRERVPRAFAAAPGTDGALLLVAHLEVPLGATLVIDDRTPDVRLASDPSGFATIVSRGTTTVAGSARTPVRISSWDQAAAVPDAAAVDGRAFVLQIGGRMDVAHGRFEHLGFGTGTTSGVAWRGAASASDARVSTADAAAPAEARVPAQGTVTDSVFAHNHFGAYTHEAVGMRWAGNTFAHNEEYGFDPHDFSNDFVVERNTAHHNGKHGFIFSRGCERNVLRDNTAYANQGHGFMIDDGRSVATDTAEARINPSNDNLVTANRAYDNAGSGVEIEGGTGNVVSGNDLARNDIGVRVKDGAVVTVADNAIAGSVRYGVHVLDPAARVSIAGNRISGSWAGINLAAGEAATAGVADVTAANTVTDVSTPLVVGEVAQRDPSWVERAGQFVRWNPVLVLWGLILGVPLVVGLVRLAGAPARLWRRSGLGRRVGTT